MGDAWEMLAEKFSGKSSGALLQSCGLGKSYRENGTHKRRVIDNDGGIILIPNDINGRSNEFDKSLNVTKEEMNVQIIVMLCICA